MILILKTSESIIHINEGVHSYRNEVLLMMGLSP